MKKIIAIGIAAFLLSCGNQSSTEKNTEDSINKIEDSINNMNRNVPAQDKTQNNDTMSHRPVNDSIFDSIPHK